MKSSHNKTEIITSLQLQLSVCWKLL